MKRLILKLSSTALLLTGLTVLPVDAQDTAAPVPARANENDPDSEIYRASDIMGLSVKNDQDEEIGKIKDLVINGSSREVLYAVVGMNDAKEKDAVYVMPWTVFRPTYGQGNAIQYTILTLPQTVWMQAPYWTNSQWRQTPYSQWSPKVNQYYETHVQTNTASNSKSTSVRTNKPVIKQDEDKNAAPSGKDKPAVQPKKDDKPQSKTEANKPTDEPKPKAAPEPKPKTNTEPKANPEPKAAAKPPVKEAKETVVPAAKNTKIPAPKNPDPAGPNTPVPSTPRDPKAPAPNPK